MKRTPPDILADGVRWFDDWYAVETVAPGVTAIGEPLYHQINWSYLVEGVDQALLFDTGPGERNIAPVVRELTKKPVAALASHMHYDHTGNLYRFPAVWAADLPELRAHDNDGLLDVPDILHLGSHENRPWIPVRVARWIKIGDTIELGDRSLTSIHTPGHAVDEVSLFDAANNILFAADFVYPGELYAQLPGSDLAAYLAAAHKLIPMINADTTLLCAHGQPNDWGRHGAPRLTCLDVKDLTSALEALKASELMPPMLTVNAKMKLLTCKQAFAAWQHR
jgi:hydroxyacylglutathione hydrolase